MGPLGSALLPYPLALHSSSREVIEQKCGWAARPSLSSQVMPNLQMPSAPSQRRGDAMQQASRHFSLARGMVRKFIMCQMYNIIKIYYSQAKCSYSIWEHCVLACLIDPSIDCMLALQTTPWPEAIRQPLEKAVGRSLPSLI